VNRFRGVRPVLSSGRRTAARIGRHETRVALARSRSFFVLAACGTSREEFEKERRARIDAYLAEHDEAFDLLNRDAFRRGFLREGIPREAAMILLDPRYTGRTLRLVHTEESGLEVFRSGPAYYWFLYDRLVRVTASHPDEIPG
jgi:hypothetical protein